MRNLLLQLDSSRHPSVFDQVVAYDGGADQILSYGGVSPEDVRDLVHGCMFTRGPKDLRHTAIWIGGNNMSQGEQLLAMAVDAMFPPLTVSVMLDSNGSNTTAVAAVVKIEQALGNMAGKKVVVLAGTGPVGQRAAGLLARDGALVTITSRKPEQGEKARQFISARFNVQVEATTLAEPSQLPGVLDGAEVVLNSGPAGVQMVAREAWAKVKSLKVAVDLNAVPPLGLEGIKVEDAGVERDGVLVYGAFGVGNFKTKLHKRCIARLFERNDLVLDAEAIQEIAREMAR
jgi:hypothetical protein